MEMRPPHRIRAATNNARSPLGWPVERGTLRENVIGKLRWSNYFYLRMSRPRKGCAVCFLGFPEVGTDVAGYQKKNN